MKIYNLTKQYHEFLAFADEYVSEKFDLEKICNDYFFIAVSEVFPSGTKGYLRIVLDSFGDDFSVIKKYWVEVSGDEVERFIYNFKVGLPTDMQVLDNTALIEFESTSEEFEEEEPCDCPDCAIPLKEKN